MFILFILYAEFTINEINIVMAITIQLTSYFICFVTYSKSEFILA